MIPSIETVLDDYDSKEVEAFSEVMEDAADIVEKGWCQKRSVDMQGNHCFVGGIMAALEKHSSSSYVRRDALEALLAVCSSLLPGPHHFVPDWNDAYARTKTEVLDQMRFTAKEIRKVGEERTVL